MSGKKDTGAPWHQTTVVLRSDIYRQALEQGIDISDACNVALAGLTGNEYRGRRVEEAAPQPPVIVARNGGAPHTAGRTGNDPVQELHPVINADDPSAPARVVQAKTRVKKAIAEEPLHAGPPAPAVHEEKPAETPGTGGKRTASPVRKGATAQKRSKGEGLKKFISTRIVRSGDPADAVGKDELYELFLRFCRDGQISPVPERRAVTVALKNQFALVEKNVNGIPSWTGIRLK